MSHVRINPRQVERMNDARKRARRVRRPASRRALSPLGRSQVLADDQDHMSDLVPETKNEV
jgi:hypothetical protein